MDEQPGTWWNYRAYIDIFFLNPEQQNIAPAGAFFIALNYAQANIDQFQIHGSIAAFKMAPPP